MSRFDKDPSRKETLQDELDYVVEYLQELRDAAPRAKIEFCEGNHEDRLRRYLQSDAVALHSLRALALPELLQFRKFRITHHGYVPYRFGNLLFFHGNQVRKHSGDTARAHYEKFGCSVIVGHCHRIGQFYRTDIRTTHVGIENGCLCVDPEYDIMPNWQRGFTTLHFAKNGTFHHDSIPIFNGQYCYGGKLYGRAA